MLVGKGERLEDVCCGPDREERGGAGAWLRAERERVLGCVAEADTSHPNHHA